MPNNVTSCKKRPNLKCALRPATCDLSQNTKCDLFPGKWSHFIALLFATKKGRIFNILRPVAEYKMRPFSRKMVAFHCSAVCYKKGSQNIQFAPSHFWPPKKKICPPPPPNKNNTKIGSPYARPFRSVRGSVRGSCPGSCPTASVQTRSRGP